MRVFAGKDPVSKKDLYLDEVIPRGPRQEREAEQARTRLLNQVDEKRNPKTRATVDQLITKYFSVLDADTSTMRGYKSKYQNHIKPLIGSIQLTRLDIETLDSFYTELRKCRDHCGGRQYVQHRTDRPHQCDEHEGDRCPRNNPKGCRRCRRVCKPHVCNGLSASTIRQVHWVLSGALDRAVVWKWISVNPAEHADKPALPTPNPQPPTVEEAAELILAAWADDPDWGTFLWLKTTTRARRGEMCALHRYHRERPLEAAPSVLRVERSIFVDDDGKLREKDTKTHQHRRIVLDPETDGVLDDHAAHALRYAQDAGDTDLDSSAYLFSPRPDGSVPFHPDTVSRRYAKLAKRLGSDTSLKNLRHYNATELIMANHNLRTVSGRLGHAGGGTTTLRSTPPGDLKLISVRQASSPPECRRGRRAANATNGHQHRTRCPIHPTRIFSPISGSRQTFAEPLAAESWRRVTPYPLRRHWLRDTAWRQAPRTEQSPCSWQLASSTHHAEFAQQWPERNHRPAINSWLQSLRSSHMTP